ncbi:pyridoxamine 5'-phosphate oxidase family protein [Gorillibacterium sp. CAU 1737]|uniref:pyridoxamine 5'-phosphate oxidase family protein n=1 Tax=Gorillibacterium sp. CAU 1737 TaxID=3140362 RepID=UPI0032611D53
MKTELAKWNDVFAQTDKIAIATSVNNMPNVRVVNFIHDERRPGVLYFSSDQTNAKVAEIRSNPQIALTTIPSVGNGHIRSRNAVVKKSRYSMEELQHLFVAKIPGYGEAVAAIGEDLVVLEIQMVEATLTTGFGEPVRLTFPLDSEELSSAL